MQLEVLYLKISKNFWPKFLLFELNLGLEKIHQQYQGVAKTLKKPPRKKTIKKPEILEHKDKDNIMKDVADSKRKVKTKQNMIVQPMLKNVDAQIFQNVSSETKVQEQREAIVEPQSEDYMVMENQVLENLMNIGCDSLKTSDSNLGLGCLKVERPTSDFDNSENKIKGIANKMPGQSLLNQDILNKNALVQSNSLRVLKAKQTKTGILNLVPTGERLQQGESSSVVGHILKSDARPQEIVTSAGKKIIIQTSFAG